MSFSFFVKLLTANKEFPLYFWCFLKNLRSSFRKMFLKIGVVSLPKALIQYGFFVPMVKIFPKYAEEVFILSKVSGLQHSVLHYCITAILHYFDRYFSENVTAVQISWFWSLHGFYFSRYISLENTSTLKFVKDGLQDLFPLKCRIVAYILHSISWLCW